MRSNGQCFFDILFAGDLGEKILRRFFTDRLRILADRRQTKVRSLCDLDAVKADNRDIFRNASRNASIMPMAE